MPTLKRSEKRERRDDFRVIYQSSRWHRYSKAYLKIHRLCVICLKEGKTVIAQCTDHRIPMAQGGDIWNPDNHQALCFKHHNSKTKQENK